MLVCWLQGKQFMPAKRSLEISTLKLLTAHLLPYVADSPFLPHLGSLCEEDPAQDSPNDISLKTTQI